jgi:hypothetical protein
MGRPVSARGVLSFSRDLEFAMEAALAKRMGCQRRFWPLGDQGAHR